MADAFNTFKDRAQYDAAMAEWQRKKAAGDPFPGPMPRLDVPNQISDRLTSVGFPTQVQNADTWQGMARAGASATPRTNPYNAQVADQSRASQLALIQQMRGQMNGPSLAGLQGQRGMAQMGQQALMQGGRAGMLGAAQAAGGLAGDTAQARAAEIMRAQAGMGGAAGNLRGADLRSAGAQAQSAIAQRGQDDALRQFYAQQGSALGLAQSQSALEALKLQKRLELQASQNDMNKMKTGANIVGSVLGGFL